MAMMDLKQLHWVLLVVCVCWLGVALGRPASDYQTLSKLHCLQISDTKLKLCVNKEQSEESTAPEDVDPMMPMGTEDDSLSGVYPPIFPSIYRQIFMAYDGRNNSPVGRSLNINTKRRQRQINDAMGMFQTSKSSAAKRPFDSISYSGGMGGFHR